MRLRNFERKNKGSGISRAQMVYDALLKGVCVDCSGNLYDVSPIDSDYLGENHKRCPLCGWQAQWWI